MIEGQNDRKEDRKIDRMTKRRTERWTEGYIGEQNDRNDIINYRKKDTGKEGLKDDRKKDTII